MLSRDLFAVSLALFVSLAACSGDNTRAPASDSSDDDAMDADLPDQTGSIDPDGDEPAPSSDGAMPMAPSESDADANEMGPGAPEAGAAQDAGETSSLSDAAPSSADGALPTTPDDDAGANDDAQTDVPDATADAGTSDGGSAPDDGSTNDASTDAGPSDAGTSGPQVPACDATRAPPVQRLGLRTVVSSAALQGLTEATQPPNSSDWYLVEQRGAIWIARDGALLPEPFLDLREEFALSPPPLYEDRGLFSIAFAPDFATSRRFYVSLTPTRGAQANFDLLLEFQASSDNPDRADPSSRRTIVELRGTRPSTNFLRDIHNGGRVTFGPDGMLYLAMGDGGGINCGDVEPDAPQDIRSPFGKLLRLDLRQPAPYGAADNPFVSDGDPRVLHYGLRNPFRFSFDRRTGDLYLGDVGQNRYEEIDYAPRGARGLNFGWAPYEGRSRDTCPSRQLRAGSTHTAPIFVADRRASATSPFSDYTAMIGGVVYRGSALPELAGAYLFGGYQGRRLGALYQCGPITSPVTAILKACDPNAPNAACLRSLAGAPVFQELRAIVEDHEGELYVVANGNSLLKIVPAE